MDSVTYVGDALPGVVLAGFEMGLLLGTVSYLTGFVIGKVLSLIDI